jgi:poly-gamma-glutamate capsule biosynthesis protein CapA/YwtB (metallophosphatase superfamily)
LFGDTIERACAPHFFATPAGTRAAIIALNDVEDDPKSALVAQAGDQERVTATIVAAHAGAAFVLAFVHWGDENTSKISGRQRELAPLVD